MTGRAAGFVAYTNVLPGEFTFDDWSAIQTNADVHGVTNLTTLFKNDFWCAPRVFP